MAHHGSQADSPPHFPGFFYPARYGNVSKSAQSGCDQGGSQRSPSLPRSPSEDAQADLQIHANFANHRRDLPIARPPDYPPGPLARPPGQAETYMQADENRRRNLGAQSWVDIPVD